MPWIFAKRVNGHDEYWTGRTGANGGLSRSLWQADAAAFTTIQSADECAATHDELRDSDEWRKVKRVDRCGKLSA
jgi:hypothetical protein